MGTTAGPPGGSVRPEARARSQRGSGTVRVTGAGEFKMPGTFVWTDIPTDGADVPVGAQVKTHKGRAVVGGSNVSPGSLKEVTRADVTGGTPSRRPQLSVKRDLQRKAVGFVVPAGKERR